MDFKRLKLKSSSKDRAKNLGIGKKVEAQLQIPSSYRRQLERLGITHKDISRKEKQSKNSEEQKPLEDRTEEPKKTYGANPSYAEGREEEFGIRTYRSDRRVRTNGNIRNTVNKEISDLLHPSTHVHKGTNGKVRYNQKKHERNRKYALAKERDVKEFLIEYPVISGERISRRNVLVLMGLMELKGYKPIIENYNSFGTRYRYDLEKGTVTAKRISTRRYRSGKLATPSQRYESAKVRNRVSLE